MATLDDLTISLGIHMCVQRMISHFSSGPIHVCPIHSFMLVRLSFKEPSICTWASTAIVPWWHPWVAVVHDTVLLAPPIHWSHEENKAEHPPHDGNFHSVEFPQIINVAIGTLWAALFQPVPQH